MGVYKYNKAIHDSFKLKTKPEPWLHAAIDVSQEGVSIAIYVWDTRQVVEAVFEPFEDYGAYRHFAEMFYKRKFAKANDNGVKLNWGSNKPLSRIDNELYNDNAATESRKPIGHQRHNAKEPNKHLYIHDEQDKLTIDFSKIEKPMQSFGTVKLSYDPHGGWYFAGKAEYIAELQKAIKEQTDIVD